jgi:hypothetical protein
LTFGHFADERDQQQKIWTPPPMMATIRRINTAARVQSAIRAIQAAGLPVGRVTVAPDGTVTVDTNNQPAVSKPDPKKPLVSWDEALNDPHQSSIRKKIR